MSNSKKPAYARKTPKIQQMVRFESSIFDGEFLLPSMDTMPLGTVADLNEGDIRVLFTWLRDAGVDEAAIGAVESLDRSEFREFRAEWGAASSVDPTESTAS